MRNLLTTLLLSTFALSSQSACADGLLYQLPKDGAYVVYDVVLGDEDGLFQHKGTFKISSVGTVTENGKKFRWIEFNMIINLDGKVGGIVKILVPEENLKTGQIAFDKIIRGWVKDIGRKVEALSQEKIKGISMYLGGKLKGAKKLKPVKVNSKLGKLKCAGISGYRELKDGERIYKVTSKTRTHKKAPFGVVSSVLIIVEKDAISSTKITLTLKEVGKNAKSELPDAK